MSQEENRYDRIRREAKEADEARQAEIDRASKALERMRGVGSVEDRLGTTRRNQ